MKKKAYITPETEVVKIKTGHLMQLSNNAKLGFSEEEDDPVNDNQRSRRHQNVWDDEEEDF